MICVFLSDSRKVRLDDGRRIMKIHGKDFPMGYSEGRMVEGEEGRGSAIVIKSSLINDWDFLEGKQW